MTYSPEIEEQYIQEYRLLHTSTRFKERGWIYGYGDGKATADNLVHIKQLIDQYGAQSLLDYGCGKAIHHVEKRLYDSIGMLDVGLYDPAIPEFAVLPEREFDCVVCVDVLEHVPEQNLQHTLTNIIKRGRLFSFFMISCNPSRETLTTGENAHVTLRDPEWWLQQLGAFSQPIYTIISHGGCNTYYDVQKGTKHVV